MTMMMNDVVSRSLSIQKANPTPIAHAVLMGLARTLPPGYIHVGVAKEILPTLVEFGIDPDPIIRSVELDPGAFEETTNVIPQAALGRLLSLCVSRTHCPHFGLLVGQRATILSLGMVGRLMQHSDTVGDALQSLVSNLSIQNRGAVPSLTVEDGMVVFCFSIYQPDIESAEQICDGALAVTVNALRTLCGSDWKPLEVLLPRSAPANPEPYRRHFRAPVRFNQEVAALVLPESDLDLRVMGADPLLREMLEERVKELKGGAGSEFSDDIRRLLRTRLTSDRCSADDIARLLAMHRRTLSRRLKGGGMGYRAITNEIRFEIARQLLEDTEVPLCQIAVALGYSEASAFTRAFRRWSGQTPRAWRSEGRQS